MEKYFNSKLRSAVSCFKIASLCLMCAVFFSGCLRQDETPLSEEYGSTLELSFGDNPKYSISPYAKAGIMGDSGKFFWEDDDPVSIYFAGSTNAYKSFPVKGAMVDVSSETDPRAKFAIYPTPSAPSSDPFEADGSPRVIYPQTYSTRGIETDSQMPILAVNDPNAATNANKLIFYHVGGLLRIKLDGLTSNIKSVKAAFEKTTVTGTFKVDVENTEAPKAKTSGIIGTGGKEVVFNLPSEGVAGTAYINVPLPLGDYSYEGNGEKLTLTLYNEANATGSSAESFETDINLRNVERADGRLCGFSLIGLTTGVVNVAITNTPPNNTLYLYDSPYYFNLTSTVFYNNATQSTDPARVTWSSSNSNIVEVDHNGLIIAKAVGTALISIVSKEDPNYNASIEILVEQNSTTGNFVERPFSVSDSHTVIFSPGYLQATLTTSRSATGASWTFAQYQYDYIGAETGNTSTLDAGTTIDLFGWSGNSNFGVSTSDTDGDYINNSTLSLSDFFDWGINPISWRGTSYAANTYRTPTYDELDYIFNSRTGTKAGTVGASENCRYSVVTVNNVVGVLLYPDGFFWNRYTMGEFPTRFNVFSPSCGSYTGEQWLNIEKEGAVFLPYAGEREGNSVYNQGSLLGLHTMSIEAAYNLYPSSESWASPHVYTFMNKGEYASSTPPMGRSVRLIKDGMKPIKSIILDQASNSKFNRITLHKGTESINLTGTVTFSDGTTSTDVAFEVCPASAGGSANISSFSTVMTPSAVQIEGSTLKKLSVGYAIIRAKFPERVGVYSSLCIVGLSNGTFLVGDNKELEVAPSDLVVDMTDATTFSFSFAPYFAQVTSDLAGYHGEGSGHTSYYQAPGKVLIFNRLRDTHYGTRNQGNETFTSEQVYATKQITDPTASIVYDAGYWRLMTYEEARYWKGKKMIWTSLESAAHFKRYRLPIGVSATVHAPYGTFILDFPSTITEDTWNSLRARGYWLDIDAMMPSLSGMMNGNTLSLYPAYCWLANPGSTDHYCLEYDNISGPKINYLYKVRLFHEVE